MLHPNVGATVVVCFSFVLLLSPESFFCSVLFRSVSFLACLPLGTAYSYKGPAKTVETHNVSTN